jgi:hypothetical protein
MPKNKKGGKGFKKQKHDQTQQQAQKLITRYIPQDDETPEFQ